MTRRILAAFILAILATASASASPRSAAHPVTGFVRLLPASPVQPERDTPTPRGVESDAVRPNRADAGTPTAPVLQVPEDGSASGILTAAIGGLATWYDDGPGLYAAVPTYTFGDRRYDVEVCYQDRCVVVTVRDFCGCPGDRIIDLSPSAFRKLAPLSRGVIPVTVFEGARAVMTLPPTDTAP